MLERIADHPREFVLDLTEVPIIDSSGARSFLLLARKLARRGGRLVIVGASGTLKSALRAQGLDAPLVVFADDLSRLTR